MYSLGNYALVFLLGAALLGGTHLWAYRLGGAHLRQQIEIQNSEKREEQIIQSNKKALDVKELTSRITKLNEQLDLEAELGGSGCGFNNDSLHRINSIR